MPGNVKDAVFVSCLTVLSIEQQGYRDRLARNHLLYLHLEVCMMEYDLMLSVLFYLCGCFYMLFSASIIATHVNSKINWLFVTLVSVLAIWSFSYALSNTAPTFETCVLWRTFSAYGWGTFSSFLLHFILILTGYEHRFNKRSMLIMLYLPALINIILFGPGGFLTAQQYPMVRTKWGWMNMVTMYCGSIWLNAYYILYSIASLVFLFSWWKKYASNAPERRRASQFIQSVILLFLIEAVVDILPEIFNRKFFPKAAIIFMVVPVILLFILLKNAGLIKRYKRTFHLQGPSHVLTDDRTRLFKVGAVLFEAGAALYFLVGYFGFKRKMESELIVAGSMIFMALFIRLIPIISKKHSTQSKLFLGMCSVGMLYLTIMETETGGVTIWAVYVLFLLFTVILDDKINALILSIYSIGVQIAYWIVKPEVVVTINGNEYLARILIIILSYVAVSYLTNEYSAKVKGYKGIAEEQEMLERISSSFISVNNENVHEIVDKMMKMTGEILEFCHAFLIGFDHDREDATLLNIYVRNDQQEQFPHSPGTKFKTAEMPLLQSMIVQNTPMICEDTSTLSFDEAGKQLKHFMRSGVKSFFAMPIQVDNEIDGVFVVEYNERMQDTSLTERRYNFLRVVANIMGDARKKILYEERLYDIAYFDEATKLANRNMLKIRLNQYIQSAQESERIAVIDIELDNLRMINDTYGHAAGEQIMVKAADMLKQLLHECCDLSRAKEDEFVVLLPQVQNQEQIRECGQKMLAAFSNPVSIATGAEALFVVLHIGVAMYPDDGRDADTLLKNADLAGYEAKNTNERIVFYTERMENHITENTMLTNKLFKALDNNEFYLEFQPQIRCDTEKAVGIEALLRWRMDGNQRVFPDRFIPILEKTGLIYDVGLWVLEQAIREHQRLIARGFPPLRISVNLSVVQLQKEDVVDDVGRVIRASGIDPKYIDLEITESWFSTTPEDTIQKLHELRAMGVRIAIDDFGKGYSSLHRLKLVPFDRIKIDKAIIDNLDLQSKKASITEIMILLAKAFKAEITAEGVETKEQVDFLRSTACDEIQGYYYSRPLSAEALEEFLKKQ
jgi:diguanylate cyclase (GGDEF)-like protein